MLSSALIRALVLFLDSGFESVADNFVDNGAVRLFQDRGEILLHFGRHLPGVHYLSVKCYDRFARIIYVFENEVAEVVDVPQINGGRADVSRMEVRFVELLQFLYVAVFEVGNIDFEERRLVHHVVRIQIGEESIPDSIREHGEFGL